MIASPSILLLDDGELDQVADLLDELGTDAIRLQHRKIVDDIPGPRDLLICNGRRALTPPRLSGDHRPLRICIHNQDFKPLRERLRSLGIDYLIHSSLDPESLSLFLQQLLHRGAERRQGIRLPLKHDVQYRIPASARKRPSKLVEISSEGALVHSLGEFPEGSRMSLILPRSLGGGDEFEITARVLFNRSIGSSARYRSVTTGLAFDDLRRDEAAKIDFIMSGGSIATSVTPLSPPRAAEEPAQTPTPVVGDRRNSGRIPFSGQVDILGRIEEGSSVGVGCDLSPSGIRILECSGLSVGEHVTLAIYPGPRKEPTLVIGRVVRVEENSAALAFEALTQDIAAQIERLAKQHPIESLHHKGGLLVAHNRAHGSNLHLPNS